MATSICGVEPAISTQKLLKYLNSVPRCGKSTSPDKHLILGCIEWLCTACEGHLYAYKGTCDAEHHAVLSKLNVSTLTWSLVSSQDPNGPMRKWECGLVCFHGCVLACFGGDGIPNDPIQPGSEFV